MNVLESLLYGFAAGVSEVMPISSQAHRYIIGNLFGAQQYDPVLNILVSIAALVAVLPGASGILEQIRRSGRSRIHMGTRYSQNTGLARFLKNAILSMLIIYFLCHYWVGTSVSLLHISICLLLNGLALFIPCRMIQGNKTAAHMSLLDSLFMGASGALSALPGFSGIGLMTSALVARGAQRQKAFQWALALVVPLIVVSIFTDFISVFTLGSSIVFTTNFFGYLFAVLGGYFGGYVGVFLMKNIINRSDFAGYAYYCWGASLFSFLLYLIVA